MRLYERRAGLAGLFGDALLDERRVSRVAFWDALERRFVVEEDGGVTSYPDAGSLALGFFGLHGLALQPGTRAGPAAGEARGRARYVAARAEYDPVNLSPPLTILTLFGVAARISSPWARCDVPAAAGAAP